MRARLSVFGLLFIFCAVVTYRLESAESMNLKRFDPASRDHSPSDAGAQGTAQVEAVPTLPRAQAAPQAEAKAVTVYVTRTGAKYHRDSCRYLARSKIPMALGEAAARYGPCSICNPPILGKTSTDVAGARTLSAPSSRAPSGKDDGLTVYVTRTGTRYHRDGCRHLARSRIPMPLKEAAVRYGPCSVCSPPVPK